MDRRMTIKALLELLMAEDGLSARLVDAQGRPVRSGADAPESSAQITDVTFDSRQVTEGALFVCKGASFRDSYLEMAVRAGGACYLAQEAHAGCGVPGIVVSDVRRAMARVACAFFGNPSSRLSLIAVTGTKGKTTVAFYVDAILRARGAGRRSGMLTGIVVDDGRSRTHASNTTPESVELQRHLARAVDSGCDAVVMEASSQGFKYDRTLGCTFAVGVFTNIGEDHISPVEHPTFEDYYASKLKIFSQAHAGVVDLDAAHVDETLARARRECERVLTYSLGKPEADVYAEKAVRLGQGVWDLCVRTPSGSFEFTFRALGAFNVSNALAAISACESLGVSHEVMAAGLADVRVPGRMERHDAPGGELTGIVDYAHNELSMRAALTCLRQEFPGREVTVVFGSCGDRGTHRRSGLGHAAGELADRVILTEDDPAGVPVDQICAEIGRAVHEVGGTYEVVCDRPSAIRRAIEGAHRPAVILLAGKGAEDSILRTNRREPCTPDAQQFCELVGAPFTGYADVFSGQPV